MNRERDTVKTPEESYESAAFELAIHQMLNRDMDTLKIAKALFLKLTACIPKSSPIDTTEKEPIVDALLADCFLEGCE